MEMENLVFPSLPWDSHGNENKIALYHGNGMEMEMAWMGMGMLIKYGNSFYTDLHMIMLFDQYDGF